MTIKVCLLHVKLPLLMLLSFYTNASVALLNYSLNGLIYNCPVTLADARRAVTIYGPCVANLKGTAVKHPSDPVLSLIPIPVPASILEHHKHLTLCVDIFYVQQIPFLTTISRQLRFRTVAHLLDRSRASLLKEVSTVLRFYHSRGFLIPDIHCDHEFDCIKNDILPCQLNITPKDDHVGEIERSIRTIKERVNLFMVCLSAVCPVS